MILIGLIVDIVDIDLLNWIWLWLIDYNLTMIWFDLMITIWLQQFVDNNDDVYDHDGYVDEQHTDAKVQLS